MEDMRDLGDAESTATIALLLRGADEIERLRKIIKDYAHICQCYVRQIDALQQAVAKDRIVVVE